MGLNTIGALLDNRVMMRAYCEQPPTGCGHYAEIDLEALAKMLGRDHGSMHDDLVPKMRCSKCGSRRVSINISPEVPDYLRQP